jgi:hypothetical protein
LFFLDLLLLKSYFFCLFLKFFLLNSFVL